MQIPCLPFRILSDHHHTEKIAELEGLKALVADDDFNTCDSVTKILVKVGMRSEWTLSGREAVLRARQSVELVDTAENGTEAVEKVKNSTPGNYNLVLMDVQLPDRTGQLIATLIPNCKNPFLK